MATLIIGSTFSRCSACGGNASPYDRKHTKGGLSSGWDIDSSLNNNNGCGVIFDRIESDCIGVTGPELELEFWTRWAKR